MNKQELIKALKEERNDYHTEYNYDIRLGFEGAIEMVEELLEPTEAEPLVIPQFVADFIEKWKNECLTMSEWFEFYCDDEEQHKVFKWLYDNDYEENTRREYLLIDAIRYGYEVEGEKLYYVKLPNTNSTSEYLYLAQGNVSGDYWFNSRLERLDYEANTCKHKFTEKEIKAIDERYWVFAVEVAE